MFLSLWVQPSHECSTVSSTHWLLHSLTPYYCLFLLFYSYCYYYLYYYYFHSLLVCSSTLPIWFWQSWDNVSLLPCENNPLQCSRGHQHSKEKETWIYRDKTTRKACAGVQLVTRLILSKYPGIKDGAYHCYCAYVLGISRFSGFLWVVLTITGIFLHGLKLCGEVSKCSWYPRRKLG